MDDFLEPGEDFVDQQDDAAEEAETLFDEPDEEALGAEAADEDLSAVAASADDRLLDIKGQVEAMLMERTRDSGARLQTEDAYEGVGNVVGVALGVGSEGVSGDVVPGEPTLTLFVVEPTDVEQAKAVLVDSMGISAAASDEVPVDVIVTGKIEAQRHDFKIRPAPAGVSVGHVRVTAGTIGVYALGRRAPRNRRLLMVSNNHVIANSNNARFGDPIIQPGRVDGGVDPRDRIAILERFVPIRFGGGQVNYIDAATGWCWPRRVRPEHIYLYRGQKRLFRIGNQVGEPRVGMTVGKSGRTTQLTVGRVTHVGVSINVGYGGGRVAFFRDQVAIRGLGGRTFSAGGDSGSAIWTWDRRRTPVALLFAGGGGYTFANRMSRVVRALDVNLYTG